MTQRPLAVAATALLLAGGTTRLAAQMPIVIRRAEIDRSGWNRISELLEGAVGWGKSSVDGSTFAASPDGLPQPGESAAGTAQWLVFVDDQPVQTNMFGLHLLELIPVSPGMVDSVVFVRGPSLVNGVPAPRGAIRIFTRHESNGPLARVTYEHGDETGDPGPYRYTVLQSPNLEKVGPFAHADLGYGATRWSVDLGAHFTSLNTTDSIIQSRFPGFASQVPQDVMTVTPDLRAELRAFGRHELLASYGEQRGLLLVPTTTREQSVRSHATTVGLGGTLDSIAGVVLGYGASVWAADARELDSPLPFVIDHRRELRSASIDAERRVGPAGVTIGVGAYDWRLERDDGTRTRTAARGLGAVHVAFTQSVSSAISAALVNGSRGTTADGSASLAIRLDSLTSVRVGGATIHEHPDLDGTWIDAVVLGREPKSERARFSSGAITVQRQFVTGLRLAAEARLERVSDWRMADAPILPGSALPDSSPLPTVSGTFAGGGLRLESLGPGVWHGMLAYERTVLASGDAILRDGARSSPSDELRAQLAATPVRDFRATVTADLTNGTIWPAFGADSTTLRVPAITRLDASAEKWMWSRRLRIQVLFQNLLNRPERYHPYGAQWNLRWHLVGTLVLPPM